MTDRSPMPEPARQDMAASAGGEGAAASTRGEGTAASTGGEGTAASTGGPRPAASARGEGAAAFTEKPGLAASDGTQDAAASAGGQGTARARAGQHGVADAGQDSVADAVQGNWVDRFAPAPLRPYLRLSRADRPIGTWLLLLPCWWGLALGSLSTGRFGLHDLWIAAGCAIGAFLMRGAGCTWNDITDRDIDGSVARTRSRPIPSGAVGVRAALGWMLAQSLVALLILLTFNGAAIALGFLAILPVAVYPFAKRFTWWPQVFLGLAFNWGALLAWTAHTGSLGWPAVVLYLGGIAWTLFYDTIYAHQDAEDDALIGVKSTARLFGAASPRWLRGFLVACVALVALAVILAVLGGPGAGNVLVMAVALGGPWAMGWHMAWQLRRFDPEDHPVLLRLFRSNRDAGLLPLPFFAAAFLLAL